MELNELKRLHDKAYDNNQVTRERAADDSIFYHVTQWDDTLLDTTQLEYRGEFNIIRKAGRQVISDLRANPVQVDFQAKADTREDGADLLDGLYLSDDRTNTSREAYDNAAQETVVCGVGAWELYTDYESNRAGNNNQVIKRRPIYEANNNCFWDPNAKLLDKSDAQYVSILVPYSEDGYRKLVLDLTGDEPDSAGSFAEPEESYVFPWVTGDTKHIYVTTFYYRELVKDTVLTMVDPLGQPVTYLASDLEELMDELIDAGYNIEDEREIERYQVTRYIASGSQILEESIIAGECIPVVPMYGERAFVEGEEHYEGITRLAKDPQRLRNFQLSYLATINAQSPRPKSIFFPEQIQGFEYMYQQTGIDNNYPFVYQNRTTANGEQLPIGPVAQLPEQQVPNALVLAIQESRTAVEDVANPGLPQDIADPDLSGKAVMALQNRLDQQSMVYQQNLKHAKRRDAEIYACMASVVYDAPREVTLTLPDGSRKTANIMEGVINSETGELEILNDLTNMEFDVFAEIGPSYSSKKEQTFEQLKELLATMAPDDPMRKVVQLKLTTMIDGVEFDDMRDYARKQLIIDGVIEPETDEEKAMLEQMSQQQQQPDAAMLMGQAEMMKGQAQIMKEQRQAGVDQAKVVNEQMSTQIDAFKAETDRMKVQVDAQETGANIDYKQAQTAGQHIDNALKPADFRVKANSALRARVS